MEKKEFIKILENISTGTATAQEIALYVQWYKIFPEAELLWEEMQTTPAAFSKTLLANINAQIQEDEKPVQKTKHRKLWPRIAAAAAILFAICAIALLFYTSRYGHYVILNPFQDLNAKNDIGPGTNRAFITLSDGKIIHLSSSKKGVVIDASKLTYNDGSLIKAPTMNGHHPELVSEPRVVTSRLTITTPRGGEYQVTLPDGTLAILNAASSLQFPASFAGLKERRVILTGEAHFNVIHNSIFCSFSMKSASSSSPLRFSKTFLK